MIPAVCEIVRGLPSPARSRPRQDVEPLIRAALGDGEYELEWIEAVGGTRSAIETPLWDALDSFVEELEPGAGARTASRARVSPTATTCARRSGRSRTASSR